MLALVCHAPQNAAHSNPNLLMSPSQQETPFEGFCALIQDTIHGTSVCTPEAGEQQKRSITRKSDGTSPPRTKQETSRAPRPQTQAKLASLFSAMAKHNEDSPRYTPPVNPAAVPVEIGVCRLELSRNVCLELSWRVYTHNTYMCMWPHARMLHDQRIAAELAIRTPATIHPNPRISGFAADLAAECAENRRGFSPPPTRGIPLRLSPLGFVK